MGYYKIKNLKIDKKNNKISGMVADSNWRGDKGQMIYDYYEDLFSNLNVIEDKIATLYFDLIEGNIHIDYGKYKDFVCTWSNFEDFINEYREVRNKEGRKDYELYNVYLKYKKQFDDYTKTDCILRQKGFSSRYIVRVNSKSVSINYGKEKAKKFNSARIMKNDWFVENFEIEYI